VSESVIHLLRHGQVHNPTRVLYGRLDGFRLSDAGQAMAVAVAEHLVADGRDIARVVASPLLRAQQTAAPVAAAFDLVVDTDERLLEAGNMFEGSPLMSGVRPFLNPRYWWRLRNPFRPSWGEPYLEQEARMLTAVRDAAAQVPGREAVLVSHQLPIWVARLSVEKRHFLHDPRSRECALASLTSITVRDGEMVSLAYSTPAAHVEVSP